MRRTRALTHVTDKKSNSLVHVANLIANTRGIRVCHVFSRINSRLPAHRRRLVKYISFYRT